MRRILLALVAAAALSGCIAFDDMYDDHAREECDRETRPTERGQCYDRIDDNRRDRP